jgi:hypothetical protein
MVLYFLAPMLETAISMSYNIETTFTLYLQVWIVFFVAYLSLATLIYLGIARNLQSALYNPKQLRPELESIRLHPQFSIFSVLILLASCWKISIAYLLLPLIALISGLAGLSLIHAGIRLRQYSRGWLLPVYALLLPGGIGFLILMPLAWLDSWFDLRARLGTPTSS